MGQRSVVFFALVIFLAVEAASAQTAPLQFRTLRPIDAENEEAAPVEPPVQRPLGVEASLRLPFTPPVHGPDQRHVLVLASLAADSRERTALAAIDAFLRPEVFESRETLLARLTGPFADTTAQDLLEYSQFMQTVQERRYLDLSLESLDQGPEFGRAELILYGEPARKAVVVYIERITDAWLISDLIFSEQRSGSNDGPGN